MSGQRAMSVLCPCPSEVSGHGGVLIHLYLWLIYVHVLIDLLYIYYSVNCVMNPPFCASFLRQKDSLTWEDSYLRLENSKFASSYKRISLRVRTYMYIVHCTNAPTTHLPESKEGKEKGFADRIVLL